MGYYFSHSLRSLSTAEMTTTLILSLLALFSVAMSSPWNKNWSKEDFEKEWNKEYETPDFTVVASHEFYEERLYPGATWACTNMSVDTAEDPLAGLEGKNFLQIMNSRRYKTKVPSSQMFYNLFDYINGENEGSVKIEMTKGVTTKHTVLKEDREWGDLEQQEMCFFLEKKFQQAGGSEAVPEPSNTSVYIQNRPDMTVIVGKFPGWAFTAATWQKERDILEQNVGDKENYTKGVYYTMMKSHPWVREEERINEVWLEKIIGSDIVQ